MKRTLAARAVASCLILLLIQSGCATIPKGPTPADRAAFGTIGVTRALFQPETGFVVPAKGRPEGAVKGAAIAFGSVLEGGIQGGQGISGEAAGFYLLFLFTLATAAAPVGAVVGAVKAMPGKEAASSEAQAREILERMRTQEVLRDEVVRAGIEATGRRLLPVEGIGPAAADNVASYKSLAGGGIDTILEVSLLRITLQTDKWGSDPPLKLTMQARSRLVRLSDDTVIDDREYSSISVYRKLSAWAADNAALLGEAYRDGRRKIAREIIDRIFPAEGSQDKI